MASFDSASFDINSFSIFSFDIGPLDDRKKAPSPASKIEESDEDDILLMMKVFVDLIE
jgi:hypothetical protein